MQQNIIEIPENLMRDLKKQVPAKRRGSFVLKAVSEKLKAKKEKKKFEKEFIESLKANKDFYAKEMEDWKVLETEGWPD